MLKEFKTFIMRGNVLDLAIGVIIGGAFGKIISSLVNDVIMPPIGLLLGKVQFTNLFVDLSGKGYTSIETAKDGWRAGVGLWEFPANGHRFSHRRPDHFPDCPLINRLTVKPAPVVTAEVTTKECPFCLSTIPLKATRCPNCTSQL